MFDLLGGTSDADFRATDQGEICSRKLQRNCLLRSEKLSPRSNHNPIY